MKILFFILIIASPSFLYAESEYIEVNAPVNRQLKLAIEPVKPAGSTVSPGTDKLVSEVIAFDLNMSGGILPEIRSFKPAVKYLSLVDIDFTPLLNSGFDLLLRGEYLLKDDQLTLEFRLFDVANRKMITAKRYLGVTKDLRRFAHLFANEILFALTGESGAFTTKIAYVSTETGNKEIYVMDWDGNNPLPLTKNGSINLNPDFSPDGREILFTSYKRGNPDLFRRPLSSRFEVPLSRRKGLNMTGSWSPDGSKIALALSKDGDAEIYTLDKDGNNPNRLTINAALDLYPTWSPDGSQIAFVSDRLGKPQIFVMNSDGGNARRLTTSGSYNVNPRWSPKGDRIAYSRMTDSGFHIFTISPDGSMDTQLTLEGSNENPSWSADGRFISFSSKRSSGNGIYVMRADGSGQLKVSRGDGNFFQPSWSSH
ncbi:MAG: Tol-Pal system beta propeller repeat protein TolB [Desulfuromonadaceae bacterium]|nr:Tol-Pal system beta propeller repeat protein TolB [Desulfuromonadaceae bacterium]MDD2854059.1 Tol-Pal system beta propeller repeat protein TolB [Desulfuromonadaceae bacterium]